MGGPRWVHRGASNAKHGSEGLGPSYKIPEDTSRCNIFLFIPSLWEKEGVKINASSCLIRSSLCEGDFRINSTRPLRLKRGDRVSFFSEYSTPVWIGGGKRGALKAFRIFHSPIPHPRLRGVLRFSHFAHEAFGRFFGDFGFFDFFAFLGKGASAKTEDSPTEGRAEGGESLSERTHS